MRVEIPAEAAPEVSQDLTVQVGDLPVQVHRAGTGSAVLLLHGSGPGTTGTGAWGTTARRLADRWEAVAPDQAGFGRTPLPRDHGTGLPPWSEHAADLMDALGHRTYAVVGHSMGGAVALDLAARLPERVTRVVAVSTMGTPGATLSPDLDAVWAATPDPEGAEGMLRRLVLDPDLVTPEAVGARADAMRAGASSHASMFPAPRDRWSDALASSPSSLRRIRCPVLLVHGAQDRLTPLKASALPLLDLIDDVQLHVFGGCGHVPFLEHTGPFHRLLLDFLDGAAST